jgi:maltoporin
MIQLLLVVGAFALTAASAQAVTGDNFEFRGYFRSGTRANNDDQAGCFHNKGPVTGNEFRLGNECEDYGEATLVAHHLKGGAKDPFFRSQLTIAYGPGGYTQYEPMGANLIEAYIDSGNFFESTVKYWVGKRFYRDASIHMNDDFYYANINGQGAGVYGIELPTGTLAVAYFLEQANPNQATVPASPVTNTRLKTHLLDVRWENLVLNDSQKFDIWAAYAHNPGGTVVSGTALTTDYQVTQGYALGLKHKYDLGSLGTNALSLQYGGKLLNGLTLSGTPDALGSTLIADKNRVRIVEDLVVQPSEHLGLEFATRLDRFTGSVDQGTWWDVGARPIYSFNQYFGVAVEGGVSSVKFDSDTDASVLTRFTIAPQIALGPKYFARPQLRAFYTTSGWRGSAFGAQGEVWF